MSRWRLPADTARARFGCSGVSDSGVGAGHGGTVLIVQLQQNLVFPLEGRRQSMRCATHRAARCCTGRGQAPPRCQHCLRHWGSSRTRPTRRLRAPWDRQTMYPTLHYGSRHVLVLETERRPGRGETAVLGRTGQGGAGLALVGSFKQVPLQG